VVHPVLRLPRARGGAGAPPRDRGRTPVERTAVGLSSRHIVLGVQDLLVAGEALVDFVPDRPGRPADVEAVDATGAGDAFTAGATAALSEGESLTEALAVATAVGALATTATGAMAALPDRAAVGELRGA
jgi:hypothetical protein